MTKTAKTQDTMTTSEVLPKKTVTRKKSSSTQSATEIRLLCLSDLEMACDQAVNDLYARFSGVEIAESIKRYRRRIEVAQAKEQELQLLKALTIKHSGMETPGSDKSHNQSNQNELPTS